jgi:hypothetical protein
VKQLKRYSLTDKNRQPWFGEVAIDQRVDEGINLRLKLVDMPANTVEDVEAQEKLLKEAEDKIARLRCAADMLVAAEFWGENAKAKQERVRDAAVVSGRYVEKGPTEEFEQKAIEELRGQKMFNWPLEFPEVIVKRGGFDAFVGNPPFLGMKYFESTFGPSYLSHLRNSFGIKRGRADLCAFFFRQAFRQLRSIGTFGLLATNTISQGGTQEVGLGMITQQGGTIFNAHKTMPWPGVAGVDVAVVHVTNQNWLGAYWLDGRPTSIISDRLESVDTSADPLPLPKHIRQCLQGTIVLGDGFFLTPEEASALVKLNPACNRIVKPFLDGEVVANSSSQSPEVFVIDFTGMSEQEAKTFPECYERIHATVHPERLAKSKTRSYKDIMSRWWLFWRTRESLYERIGSFSSVIVAPIVAKYITFSVVSSHCVFGNKLVVVPSSSFAAFAVLQSSLHEAWADKYSTTMRDAGYSYTPTKCFETFPFPCHVTLLETEGDATDVAILGEAYHGHRKAIMSERQVGLTQVYNLFHDAAEKDGPIERLRELHCKLDRAVVAAFGLDRITLNHGFYECRLGIRFTISESARHEVLQRLLKLNHEQYEKEVKQGLHNKKTGKKRGRKKAVPTGPPLFGDDDEERG